MRKKRKEQTDKQTKKNTQTQTKMLKLTNKK